MPCNHGVISTPVVCLFAHGDGISKATPSQAVTHKGFTDCLPMAISFMALGSTQGHFSPVCENCSRSVVTGLVTQENQQTVLPTTA
jgi:hypothetical protein